MSGPGSVPDNPLRVNELGLVVSRLRRDLPRVHVEIKRQNNQENIAPLRLINTGPPSAIIRTHFMVNGQIVVNTEALDAASARGELATPVLEGGVGPQRRTRSTTLRRTALDRGRISIIDGPGPPTPIRPHLPLSRAALRAAAQARERSAAAARPPPPMSRSATRVRRGPLATAAQRAAAQAKGSRKKRDLPLTHEDLWLNGIGPPEDAAPTTICSHHQCPICLDVKSHPVSYQCGHSHCYVCIRLWLEQHWTCPVCVTTMTGAPFRNYVEEAGLEADFPNRMDTSIVAYSWDGLVFPRLPIMPESP
ncbi:hypothetical protein DFH09DRAFT_1096563 [Mycena vulgaris]|nr:hypothetical protein DFH09DRAFT_1096563 [Mycena vulgaris]